MPARVDEAARRVRAGEREWPFELDLREGTVALEAEGRSLRLRPLLWAEKVRLARFARLGDRFVEDGLVALTLDGPPPAGGEEREALAALAEWLNAPGEPGLPLRSQVLGLATLEVCRAMGLTPADLDGREAAEVELLWRVAGSARGAVPEAEAPLPEGTTRILIAPDPEPGPEPDPDPEPGPEARATGAAPSAQSPAPVADEPGMRNGARRGWVPAAADEPPARATQTIDLPPEPAVRALANGSRPAVRFRPLLDPPADAVGARPSVAEQAAPRPARPQAPSPVRPVGVPVAANEVVEPSRPVFQPDEREPQAKVVPGPSPTATLAPDDREALFDDLADRLERAAAELGIDPER